MKETTRQALTHALFEAMFVVFGVLLALAANEWRQRQLDEEAARAALAGIREEVEANRAVVSEALEYHQRLLSLIQSAGRGEGPAPQIRDFTKGFIAAAGLSDTAWTVASATGTTANMSYDTVLRLSRIYDRQEQYEQQAFSAGELIYAALFHQGAHAIVDNWANLGSIISTFQYREVGLLAAYDEVLESLEQTAI